MALVYLIQHDLTRSVYVGSTCRALRDRQRRHLRDLRLGVHHCIFLSRLWNKHAGIGFEFIEAESCSPDEVIALEQAYIDRYKKSDWRLLNANPVAANCSGRLASEATRLKLRQSHLGQKQTLAAKGKQQATWAAKAKRAWSFKSPEGKVYENIRALRAFCRQHALNLMCMRRVDSREIYHHKYWTLPETSLPLYAFVSPAGKQYADIYDLATFSKENDLNRQCMWKLWKGQSKTYKGWKRSNS